VGETLDADLVVDAAGRGSHTPRWLAAIGARTPAEERIDTGLAYATRLYRAEPADLAIADYRGIYLVPHPGTTRSGVVMPIEEPGHYLVTLTGLAGDEPPTDPAGFEAFAAGLEHRFISEWLARAQPVGPPMGHRRTANVRRRYDRLAGPAGLLVVGDAACAFNPVYGQGMSVAALGAAAVARMLAAGTAKRMQRAVIRAAEDAWAISAGADKAMPGVTGNVRTGAVDRIASWYLARLQRMLPSNRLVGNAFLEVIHLVAPARSLFAPSLARTVLFGRSGPDLPGPPLFPEA
jgi:flavin-dependent dehydrogenase